MVRTAGGMALKKGRVAHSSPSGTFAGFLIVSLLPHLNVPLFALTRQNFAVRREKEFLLVGVCGVFFVRELEDQDVIRGRRPKVRRGVAG